MRSTSALSRLEVSADGDALLGAGVLVPGRHVQDAVGVDLERHLDLGLTPGRGPYALEPEAAEHPIVGGPLPLTLEDHDVHRGLVVLRGAEHLDRAGRDGRVALDDLGHHAAHRFHAQ